MPKVEWTIQFETETGNVGIGGPIDNPILVYGVLELAKTALTKHFQSLNEDRRITPATMLPGGLTIPGN
jgi:hypothetical protein